jgi:hypothetical protein
MKFLMKVTGTGYNFKNSARCALALGSIDKISLGPRKQKVGLLCYERKEGRMGSECSANGKDEKYVRNLKQQCKGSRPLGRCEV